MPASDKDEDSPVGFIERHYGRFVTGSMVFLGLLYAASYALLEFRILYQNGLQGHRRFTRFSFSPWEPLLA
jgi:hypothetical protein